MFGLITTIPISKYYYLSYYCLIEQQGIHYGTMILPVALYKCEAWSFTLYDEVKFRVFDNKLSRTIYEVEKQGRIRRNGIRSLMRINVLVIRKTSHSSKPEVA